jgi:hypothetical protein
MYVEPIVDTTSKKPQKRSKKQILSEIWELLKEAIFGLEI